MIYYLKNKKGFTIIEVLIVLAIAGLIMLIVFLAVPALQRNSRNNQIKNDAKLLYGFVNEYMSNNLGRLPSCSTVDTNTGEVKLGSTTTACNAGGSAVVVGKVMASTRLARTSSGAFVPAGNYLYYLGPNRKCTGVNATNQVTTASANKQFSVAYSTESSSGRVSQCI